MSLQAKDIMQRWERIRSEEKCNLSLTPQSVAEYLRISESNLVQARILESLIQFANRRLDPDNNKFVSTDPPTPGDMATCEGLEAFLVPAVEDALSFSKFLEHYQLKGGDKTGFVKAIKQDIESLLKNWEKGRFSGEPYANTKKIKDSIDPNGIDPNFKDHFNQVNITESAALACRVLIHLLTLKLNRTAADEGMFQKDIGDELDENRLFASLSEAIGFLVRAFQKNHEGATTEDQIVSSKVGMDIGSGWSWTDYPGLPPMLFFTAAAVDAFAELDLYLIRTVRKREWVGDGLKLAVFYKEQEESLQRFQLCVDMARRWVQTAVLPTLIKGYGQYVERFPHGTKGAVAWDPLVYNDSPTGYGQYQDDLNRWKERGLGYPPMVFYNSLYALQILLWSWGDWNDSGESVDDDLKNQINRAISQLVYNYSSIPVVQEILNRFKYVFYLPGKDIFRTDSEKEREYLDSAFLQLLTRLLVLFVVYGVGDRNMLEPIIRNLYVELLQNRHRNNIDCSALWSTKEIEVFSTQRAIQALTFYYAYASGKEIVDAQSGGGDVVLRNKTGGPLVLVFDRQSDAGEMISTKIPKLEGPSEPSPDPDRITDEKFTKYCQKAPGWQVPGLNENQAADALQSQTKALGDTILSDYKAGKVPDSKAARVVLDELVGIYAAPETSDGKLRDADLAKVEEQYRDLRNRSVAADN